jgi:hypothetical protein
MFLRIHKLTKIGSLDGSVVREFANSQITTSINGSVAYEFVSLRGATSIDGNVANGYFF